MQEKKSTWVIHEETEQREIESGLLRRVLAYGKDLMVIENTFAENAVGALHQHPQEQVTYIVSGRFRFVVDGEEKEVGPGDSLVVGPNILHGCTCLETGAILDIYSPMRREMLFASGE